MRSILAVLFIAIALVAMAGYAFYQQAKSGADIPQILAAAALSEPSLAIKPFPFTPVIDPGHGGKDAGASSPSGLLESGVNLEISLKTAALLRFLGLSPVLTRESDISIHDESAKSIAEIKRSDLINRTKLVNATPNALLISIHQNKFEQSRYYGAQVFHNGSDSGKAFAALMQERLRTMLDPANQRQPKKPDNLVYLLKHSRVPTVLVECGFLSNPTEEQKLQSPDYQKKLALAIIGGMLDYTRSAG